MSKTTALIATFFPGLGHILRGQNVKGLTLALCFTIALCGLLAGKFLYADLSNMNSFVLLCLIAMLILWVLAFADIIKSMYFVDEAAIQAEKDRFYRQGMQYALKGDLRAAANAFEMSLKLDKYDEDALFQLGIALIRLGETGRGRKILKSSLEASDEEKWRWEVMRGLTKGV